LHHSTRRVPRRDTRSVARIEAHSLLGPIPAGGTTAAAAAVLAGRRIRTTGSTASVPTHRKRWSGTGARRRRRTRMRPWSAGKTALGSCALGSLMGSGRKEFGSRRIGRIGRKRRRCGWDWKKREVGRGRRSSWSRRVEEGWRTGLLVMRRRKKKGEAGVGGRSCKMRWTWTGRLGEPLTRARERMRAGEVEGKRCFVQEEEEEGGSRSRRRARRPI
jgi:hypothetical protein